MKKFFFTAAVVLVSLFCISANAENRGSVQVENYVSSVTADIAGVGDEIGFETKTLVVVYNLMPQKVKDMCVAAYKEIAPRIEKNGMKSFKYGDVAITPVKNSNGGTDLKFSYQGHSLVVNNYSRMEFDAIFGF